MRIATRIVLSLLVTLALIWLGIFYNLSPTGIVVLATVGIAAIACVVVLITGDKYDGCTQGARVFGGAALIVLFITTPLWANIGQPFTNPPTDQITTITDRPLNPPTHTVMVYYRLEK